MNPLNLLLVVWQAVVSLLRSDAPSPEQTPTPLITPKGRREFNAESRRRRKARQGRPHGRQVRPGPRARHRRSSEKLHGCRRQWPKPRLRLKQIHFKALHLVAEQTALRLDHLAELLGIPFSRAMEVVRDCVELGHLNSRHFLADEQWPWVWVTSQGARTLGVRGFRSSTPSLHRLPYLAGLNLARVHFLRRAREKGVDGVRWVSRKEIEDLHGRQDPYRVPDAMIEGNGQRVAIVILPRPRAIAELSHRLVELERNYDWAWCVPSQKAKLCAERVVLMRDLTRVSIIDIGF